MFKLARILLSKMIPNANNKQNQKSGNNSTNIQAQRDIVVNHGLGYEDIKKIFIDLFRENFLTLQNDAQNTIKQRFEEFTNNLIAALKNESQINLDAAKDPDLQYAIFTSQKEYARSGKEDLLNLLTDLLVERFKSEDHDFKKIVLNEAIQAANKLTKQQLNTMSLVFLGAESGKAINDVKSFENHLKTFLPFCEDYKGGSFDFRHIEYVGCGNINFVGSKFTDHLKANYGGVLSKGFDAEKIKELQLTAEQIKQFIIPCLRDDKKLQINALNHTVIEDRGRELGLENEKINRLKKLHDDYLYTEEEILELLAVISPQLLTLNNNWNTTNLGQLKLTPVGIAMAQANITRITGEKYELNIWLNAP
ncbi:hypothetical protein OQJ13_07980 [Legionella sp. PATHC035]|uniref:LPO_1073/Vpar_1526 family protein n=1 Tax=Legionella sp. PATHC035 TaxID=2992040 RepID=UPI00224397FB|nr:LPO_1073/Vpar_1526 family protein [Legionella sp. PATHC035]MCW8408908.1 hypothetical protein [Legionella sp. PATHC035]